MTLVITMVALAVVLLLVNAAVDLYRKLRPGQPIEDSSEYGTGSSGGSGTSDVGTQSPIHSQGHHHGFDGGGHGGDFGGGHGH